ncbi:hypothetical protein Tco_1212922 [Tanacetum coccineum]
MTKEASTGPSAEPQDDTSINVVRDTPSPTVVETRADMDKTNSKGDTEILDVDEDQSENVSNTVALEERTVNMVRAVMSSASSAVTYTSVYTDSEPGRVFWGADEEISDGGSPRVIVYGYDGLPMQPVAPPSPDYIPDPEEPQTPPVPQDEDEREPMFIQAHDPDYVPEPMYPEYIPLEDEHVFPAEEQPLPPVDSPTAESPGYVAESDPKEDLEEYEDDETEDGPVDYPMDGGDDGDDDDGDSSGITPMMRMRTRRTRRRKRSTQLWPTPLLLYLLLSLITVWLQAFIPLPPEAEVERLLAMTTLSPSPPISLSPPPIPSPLLPSSGFTAVLPSPLLPLLPPSIYIPPPIDRKDDVPEFELLPRKRPTGGRRVDYGFVSTVDAKARRQGISEFGVTKLAELHERDTQDLYALLEDAQDGESIDYGGGGLCFPRGLGLLDKIESGEPSRASDPP